MESARSSGSLEVSARADPLKGFRAGSDQMERLATLGAHSAGLAHELKNALVPVKTMVQLLLQRHPDADLAQMTTRELSRIDSLLSQMLLMSAPTPAHAEQVRMHELLDYTLKLLGNEMARKTLQLEQSYCAARDSMLGNGYQLQQAIMNLLLNAMDSMQPGGKLTVATRNISRPAAGPLSLAAEDICIAISDTGCGIAVENLPRLFEPFFTTREGGTGLGLYMTRRIISDHHGAISAESRLGEGTTFAVTLPIVLRS